MQLEMSFASHLSSIGCDAVSRCFGRVAVIILLLYQTISTGSHAPPAIGGLVESHPFFSVQRGIGESQLLAFTKL